MPKVGDVFGLKNTTRTRFEIVALCGQFVVMKRKHEGDAYDVAPIEAFRSLQSIFVRLH